MDEMLHALGVFCARGQVVELRALGVLGRRAVCEVYADHGALARRAAELDAAGAAGVYFTPNPLRPDLAGGKASARKEDVASRRWLLVDVDPVRPADCSSTEEELRQAWAVLDACRGTLEAAGLRGAVVGCSGNGWHLCYPVALANDDEAQELVKSVLKGLQSLYGTEAAKVDTSCHDAPRIWKLYGTTARKGQPTAERPHRRAFLVEGQPWQADVAAANPDALRALVARWRYADDARKGRPPGDVIGRAKAYIAKEPPAISGQQGHDRTFHVACVLVKDFGLSEAQALEAIQDWNRTCQPPWSEKELRHKIADAAKKEGPTGRLLNGNGHGEPAEPASQSNGTNGNGAAPKLVFPAPIPSSQLREGPLAPAIWQGLINRGAVTLMCALWKAGKTTLLTHLIRGMESGGHFCGLPLSPGRVLYVTEESESRWAKRRDRHVLRDHIDFLIRPFTSKPGWPQWQAFLAYLNELLARQPRDLVVFDTLTNLWPVKDENDASQVQAALMPLHTLAPTSGQLLVHHTRKGDGQEATASRGSGALTAFVDTILEFRRFSQDDREDRRRVLTGYGRDEDTPDELVIELTELDGYVPHGKRTEVKARDLGADILPLLPNQPPGVTFDELMDRWPGGSKPRRRDAFGALSSGAEQGRWAVTGRGVRGDPRRYWAPSTDSVLGAPPLIGEEPGTETS